MCAICPANATDDVRVWIYTSTMSSIQTTNSVEFSRQQIKQLSDFFVDLAKGLVLAGLSGVFVTNPLTSMFCCGYGIVFLYYSIHILGEWYD